jgi:hypothetical protein
MTARRIFWTPAEFDAIARSIIARFPQLHYEHARTLQDIDLTLRELLDSAKAALSPERYRKISNASPVKVGLLAAFARLRGESAAAPDGHVRWNAEEWHQVAEALERLYPDRAYCSAGRMDSLTLAHLNAAAATLPAGRQRYFNALTGVRERLLAAYRAPVFIDSPAAARVPAAAEAPAAVPTVRHQRVFWTKEEWLLVAAELLRRDPQLNGASLERIKFHDLRLAQQVLPPERRRHGLHDMKGNRRLLQRPIEQVLRDGPPAAVEPAVPILAPAPGPALPLQPSPAEAVASGDSAGNAWEAACRPVAMLLARQVAQVLLPELVAVLGPLLAKQSQPTDAVSPVVAQPQPPEPQRPFPFIPPPRPAATGPNREPQHTAAPVAARKAPPPPKKPVVGVVGPLGAQQRVLEAAFPNVELLFVESDKQGNAVAKLRWCDRVIGMIGFMQHSTDGALHKHFNRKGVPPRYTRVTGGVTAIRSQIEAWLESGAQYQSQARGNRAVIA